MSGSGAGAGHKKGDERERASRNHAIYFQVQEDNGGTAVKWTGNGARIGSGCKIVELKPAEVEKAKHKQKDSRFFRWMRNNPTKTRLMRRRGNSANQVAVVTSAAASLGARLVSSIDQGRNYVGHMAGFENWVLEYAPESKDAKYLKTMEDNGDLGDFDHFSPDLVAAYLEWTVLPETRTLAGYAGIAIHGAGNKHASLRMHKCAIGAAHRCFGSQVNPCAKAEDGAVTAVHRESSRNMDPEEAAEPFDVLEDLPKIRNVLFGARPCTGETSGGSNKKLCDCANCQISRWPALRRVMMWTMMLLMLALVMRISTATTYSPLAQSIALPRMAAQYAADGIPDFIKLVIHKWKSVKKTNPQTVYLWRNLCRMDYCPVTALGMWLTMTGIREGPIFRVVNKNDKITDTPCSPSVYGRYMKLIFIAAGLPDRTTHSLRHTAMGWFARCHISELMRRAAGRWAKTSTAFNGYATRGVIIREEHVATGKMDPIFKFWAARAPVFTASK